MLDLTHDIIQSLSLSGLNRNNRNPELRFETLAIYAISLLAYLIHHIDGKNGGNTSFENLECEIEISLQTCPIEDINDASRLLLYDVGTGNDFLSTVGIERVRSRKVEDGKRGIFGVRPLFLINGYTRPVPDMLSRSSKGIEYGGLAGVWIAGKGNGSGHGCSFI
jgi:hypothetical protein